MLKSAPNFVAPQSNDPGSPTRTVIANGALGHPHRGVAELPCAMHVLHRRPGGLVRRIDWRLHCHELGRESLTSTAKVTSVAPSEILRFYPL